MNKFFLKNERTVVFTRITDKDSWSPVRAELPVVVKGIVSFSGSGSSPKDQETELSSRTARVFLRASFKDAVSSIVVGDLVKLDDEEFQITRCDFRGVLPGRYPLRLEAEKKG